MIDTKIGFIITYFKTCNYGETLLRDLIETISKQNYYLILASHSSDVPIEIQKMCDFYFYQELNVVNNKKYSHGVAENNLIEISLSHLKYKNILWTYKTSYDVIVKDVSKFDEWIQNYKYKFVSCNWGDNFLCTNSFFANVDFILDNITFYDTIEKMFNVNNVLENCWQKDIKEKFLQSEIYSYPDKQSFFGDNKIDNLFYDYNKIQFWFEPKENKFYVTNNGSDFRGELKIFDYYSDLCLYYNEDFNHPSGVTMWIVPPFVDSLSLSKNGFYLEMYREDITIRINWNIKDFSYKDPMYKAFRSFKSEKDQKYHEYIELSEFDLYKDYGIDILNIKNFVDVGANFGLFTYTLGAIPGVQTYAVEPYAKEFVKLQKNLSINDFAFHD
jgi:hypothetical protein